MLSCSICHSGKDFSGQKSSMTSQKLFGFSQNMSLFSLIKFDKKYM